MRPIGLCLVSCILGRLVCGESIDLDGSVGLIRIEPGTVIDRGGSEAEVTRPFLIGRTPVTRGQFAAFVARTGHRTEAERGTSGGSGIVQGSLVQRPEFTWRSPGFAQDDAHPVVRSFAEEAAVGRGWRAPAALGRAVSPSPPR